MKYTLIIFVLVLMQLITILTQNLTNIATWFLFGFSSGVLLSKILIDIIKE